MTRQLHSLIHVKIAQRFLGTFASLLLICVVHYLTSTDCACLLCTLCDILAVMKPRFVSRLME